MALADDATITDGLRAACAAGLLVGVHAEDSGVISMHTERLQAAGRTDPAAHSEARPVESEALAIERIGRLAQAAGAGLHIHHLSSAAGMGRVRELRARGLDVSTEAVVAHLVMTVEDYARHGNLVTLNPPLRTGEDRAALWHAVAAAEINVIATDHAPHTPEEQHVADVWCAHGGFAGVETLLPVLLAQVAEGRLELTDIVRMCSFSPAQRWGIAGKGQLVPGADADMVLVDLARPFTIQAGALQSRHKVTPFDGLVSPGTVRATFLRGIMVAENGVAVGEPRGRFLQPSCPSQKTTPSSGRQL
jgi:dihydroorotase (multifunctional complex type)